MTDIEGSFAEDAVNCLGHYGITKGRTATMYDPGAPVLRWQMALFLSRAAGPAGVQLMAETADDFTDLEGVSDEIRSAINQMAALEIMSGTGSGRFSPDTAVSRKTMAEMLDAFLGKARLGKGALGGGSEDELSEVTPDDTVFTDIGNVTRGQYSAIRRMFEVGVTRGTTDSQFSPEGLVTRGQMAAFITRMLAHTVARPAGLTMQASVSSVAGTETDPGDLDLVVSLRDSSHMAMPDALVDLFKSENPGDAFGSGGSCSNDDVMSVDGTAGLCEIVSSDVPTDSDGDRELVGASFGASVTVWAWTGDAGDTFDADDTVSASLEITVTKPATKLRITDDMAANAVAAKFGDRVTFTIQVVDNDGNPVAAKDKSVGVAMSTTVASPDTADVSSSSTTSHKTDDSGRIELSYRQTDPRTSGSNNGGDKAWLNLVITYAGTDLTLDDKTTLKMAETGAIANGKGPEDNAAVVWLDTTAAPTTLTLAQAVEYHEASGTGSGAANTVTATLVDQYGDPVSRQKVEFASDDAKGIAAEAASGDTPVALAYYNAALLTRTGTPVEVEDVDPNRGLQGTARLTRTTNRRGVASLSYNRDSSVGGIETIAARVKADLSVTLALARDASSVVNAMRHEDKWDARSGDILAERIYHYWGVEPGDGDSLQGRLLVADTDNNKLVLAGDSSVFIVGYDSNDHLNGTSGAATLSGFETDLKDNAKHVSVSGYDDNAKGVSTITAAAEWDRLFPTTGTGSAKMESNDAFLGRFGSAFAADNGVIVVGAPRESSNAGRVYVYTSSTAEPVVISPPTGTTGRFGQSVDISGDVIVVGSWSVKKVYVFVKPTGGWAATDTATVELDASHTKFGRYVAIDGDTIVAAAQGGVSVFTKAGDVWGTGTGTDMAETEVRITDANIDPEGIAKQVDIDGDTIVVGSWRVTTGLTGHATGFSGYAHVIAKAGSAWGGGDETAVRLNSPEKNGQDQHSQGFARSVAVSGDTVVAFQVDVANRLVAVDEPPNVGKAHVYVKPSGDWTATAAPDATLSIPVGPGYHTFGLFGDISSDGNAIAVGAHYSQQGDWLGAVYVYTKLSGEEWASTTSPAEQYVGPTPNGRFGWGTTFDSTNGDIVASFRQEKTGPTCDDETVGEGTGAVMIPTYCLRYLPVYVIDR